MSISWFIATSAIGVLAFMASYLNNASNAYWVHIVSVLVVVGINIVFWLPAVVYLRKNKKLTFSSSVISGVLAAFVGIACVVGLVYLLLYVAERFQQLDSMVEQSTGYTSWTIGHASYWSGIAYIAALWGVNGAIFWKSYGKFSTNK